MSAALASKLDNAPPPPWGWVVIGLGFVIAGGIFAFAQYKTGGGPDPKDKEKRSGEFFWSGPRGPKFVVYFVPVVFVIAGLSMVIAGLAGLR